MDTAKKIIIVGGGIGGGSKDPVVRSLITSLTSAAGKAGDVNISTPRLSLINGGTAAASTFGSGSGGRVNINAETIEAIGMTPNFQASDISAASVGSGNAGSITLNTRTLGLHNGGGLTTSSYGRGTAGNITVNASESVEVSGIFPGSPIPSQIDSAGTISSNGYLEYLLFPVLHLVT
jgi:large exoprotein involved in heme utilization and adhesion